jgi:hypothetical protein
MNASDVIRIGRRRSRHARGLATESRPGRQFIHQNEKIVKGRAQLPRITLKGITSDISSDRQAW